MRLTLHPGRYFAGIDRPFFVSDAMIRKALRGYGAELVAIHDREDRRPPVNPLTDPGYDADWDEWAEIVYRGPPRQVDVTKHWRWLVYLPQPLPQPQPGLPTVQPAPVAPTTPAAVPVAVIPTAAPPTGLAPASALAPIPTGLQGTNPIALLGFGLLLDFALVKMLIR